MIKKIKGALKVSKTTTGSWLNNLVREVEDTAADTTTRID